jgi:hypothetical protein
MAREIDLLTQLPNEDYLLVDKDTNVAWMPDELAEAVGLEDLQAEDCICPADGQKDVCGPYPGCMQISGRAETQSEWKVVGQTRHFLVFAVAGAARPTR